jgi:hypothetical protein
VVHLPCALITSVDVGVGEITGEHTYTCLVHGDFAESGAMRHIEEAHPCFECVVREVRDLVHGEQVARAMVDAELALSELRQQRDEMFQALKCLRHGISGTEHIHSVSRRDSCVKLSISVSMQEYEAIKRYL